MEKLGFGLTLFVQVSLSKSTKTAVDTFEAAVQKCPDILSCHAISGNEDFILVVAARDLQCYKRLNDEVLLHLPHVRKKITSFSLNATKAPVGLPLELLPEFRAALAGWKP
jgi:DNA-binding Lrp family transcriptional regulator